MDGIDPDVLLEWLQTGIGDERDLQVCVLIFSYYHVCTLQFLKIFGYFFLFLLFCYSQSGLSYTLNKNSASIF